MERIKATCQFVEAQAANDLHKFHIVANAGSRMSFYDGDIVVDMNGAIQTKKDKTPIVFGHDIHNINNAIGHVTSSAIIDGRLELDGVISCDSEAARQFIASSRNGFPWEASIGFLIDKGDNIRAGEQVTVNGRKEVGPLTVARSITVYECSVVLFGADGNTSSEITATKEVKAMEENNKEKDAPQVQAAASVAASIDVNKELEELRKARAAEIERCDAIEKIAAQYGDRQFVNAAISEGWDVQKFELETLRASRNAAPAVHKHAESIDSKALEVAFLRSAGFPVSEKKYGDQILTAADTLVKRDFREIMEAACGFSPNAEQRRDGKEWVRAALSTQNLSSILSTNANAVLLAAFNTYAQQWRDVFKVGTVNDFKTAERWRISSNFEYEEIEDGEEFAHGEQSDEKFEIKAGVWGKQYELGYKAITNGEALGVFGDIMRQMAFGASVALNKACWGLLMNPATTADSKAYYHADHGSLKASCPLTLENLSAARAAFISRKRGRGVDADEQLGIAPNILLVPTSLEDKALMLTKATAFYDATTAPASDYNPNGNRFKVVAVPQLEYANYTGYSATTWYLFADPQQLAAFEIAFLNGQDSPVIRSSDVEIGRLGIAFDGHIDFGVAQEDYRGALKCTA